MKPMSCGSFALAPALAHAAGAPTVRRLLLGTAALVAGVSRLAPRGCFRAVARRLARAGIGRRLWDRQMGRLPSVLPSVGGADRVCGTHHRGGGGYFGYRRCVTDEGYGRYRGCDR